jgi:OOP family OmpA-OmpF porin
LELTLPATAAALSDESAGMDSYALPLGPFAAGKMPVKSVEGHVTRQSWRVAAQGLTSLQLLTPWR